MHSAALQAHAGPCTHRINNLHHCHGPHEEVDELADLRVHKTIHFQKRDLAITTKAGTPRRRPHLSWCQAAQTVPVLPQRAAGAALRPRTPLAPV